MAEELQRAVGELHLPREAEIVVAAFDSAETASREVESWRLLLSTFDHRSNEPECIQTLQELQTPWSHGIRNLRARDSNRCWKLEKQLDDARRELLTAMAEAQEARVLIKHFEAKEQATPAFDLASTQAGAGELAMAPREEVARDAWRAAKAERLQLAKQTQKTEMMRMEMQELRTKVEEAPSVQESSLTQEKKLSRWRRNC